MAVVGLNTLKFFWQTRTPDQAADALTRIIGHYGAEHPLADFIMIGYSFGASLRASRDQPRARRGACRASPRKYRLRPIPKRLFEIHVGDWFGSTHHEGALPPAPEIAGIAAVDHLRARRR